MHVPDHLTTTTRDSLSPPPSAAITIISQPEIRPKEPSPISTSVEERRAEFMMDLITSQPHEILTQIFTFVHVTDLAHLSRTCRFLRRTIADDDLLWKQHYLQNFDDPSMTPLSWQYTLRNLMRLQMILSDDSIDNKNNELDYVLRTCLSLLLDVNKPHPSLNRKFLARYFSTAEKNRKNLSAFLSRSSLFARAGLREDKPANTHELRQLSAKLHCFYGLGIEPPLSFLKQSELEDEDRGDDDDDTESLTQEIHPYARSKVYDLRAYKTKNFWGPFMDDGSGRADWEKAQNIMIVLAHGLRIFSELTNGEIGPLWDKSFVGLAANSFKSQSFDKVAEEPDLFQGQEDPYGVRGTWMRVVNFLDYHDLFAFNFQPTLIADDEERPPITTKEAFRLILLKLKVTKIEQPEEDDPGSDPTMPIVYFEGVSKSLHMRWDPNANSQIRGTVRTTRHGDIRWTTFSVFHGEERWRSEGIQIGGINSGRGILGNWFDKDFDQHGPAGPTAFWKISNQFPAAMGN